MDEEQPQRDPSEDDWDDICDLMSYGWDRVQMMKRGEELESYKQDFMAWCPGWFVGEDD